jgi:uncharacterized protein Smg (DUF494 family)
MLEWLELDDVLNKLNDACDRMDQEKIREILLSAPTGFNPTDEICDLVWKERVTNSQEASEKVKVLKTVS